MSDPDVIVIGSGHNGLVAALSLAKAGASVVVLEQAAEIGGATRSAEVTLPGCIHDLFATNFTLFSESAAYREFQTEFARLGVKFLSNDRPYASGYDGGRAVRVFLDEERTEQEIGRVSTADLSAWRNLVSFYKRTAPRFLPLQSQPMLSAVMFRQIARILAGHPADTVSLSRLLVESARHFSHRHFQSVDIRSLFTPWAFHLDFGPDVRGGAIFSFIPSMSAHLRGIRMVQGGASRLIDAFQSLIEGRGGTVRTGARVKAIEIFGNKAVGVTLEDGESLPAKRAIIANISPKRLFGTLVQPDELPAGFFRKMDGFRHAPGTFIVHLTLKEELDWRAGEDLSQFSYVHLNCTAAHIDRAYTEALAGYLPARPMLIVSQTTPVDPSRAPQGRHVVRVHARAFPTTILGDAGGTISGHEWNGVTEAVADRILDLLAEHTPNVHSALLARHVVSPADIEHTNPSLVNGDCNGGSQHLDQYYFARPALGWSKYQTPVENLYMIGASQWPGSGVNGVSGHLLARELIASRL
jgi:phytoene dehydrogenase-like protein